MEQKQESFRERLAFGEEGEHEIAEFLIQKGVSILPLYQFESYHAPYILRHDNTIVSPDLICFKNDAFMIDVKTKNQWVEYKGRVETGMNEKHYNQYNRLRNLTGKEVYIIFNHKKEEPLGYYMVKLNNYTRYWDGYTKDGKYIQKAMVFYNKEILKKLWNAKSY